MMHLLSQPERDALLLAGRDFARRDANRLESLSRTLPAERLEADRQLLKHLKNALIKLDYGTLPFAAAA